MNTVTSASNQRIDTEAETTYRVAVSKVNTAVLRRITAMALRSVREKDNAL